MNVTDDADLAPLAKVVGSRTYVGLGESYHTSGGLYRIKARAIRYLVERLGFRAFMMETPWVDALVATRYVESCEGTSLDATRSVFAVFADKSLNELFGWLCNYNQAHPEDKVSFYGLSSTATTLGA